MERKKTQRSGRPREPGEMSILHPPPGWIRTHRAGPRLLHARSGWVPKELGVMLQGMRSSSLSPLSQRLSSHSGAASSCTLRVGTAALHGFSMLMASHCQVPPALPECSRQGPGGCLCGQEGGQAARGSACPSSPRHAPRHPLESQQARDRQGTGSGDHLLSRRCPAELPHIFHPSLKQLCRRTYNMLH